MLCGRGKGKCVSSAWLADMFSIASVSAAARVGDGGAARELRKRSIGAGRGGVYSDEGARS